MKKGITLAEVLLGMVILTFALVAVLALFANCIISNESNRNLTIALSHVQFVMEEIKNESALESIKTKIDGGIWAWNTDSDFTDQGVNRLTNETITTCCYDSTNSVCYSACPPDDLLDILVVDEWDDRGGRTRDISLKTLIAEP